MDLRRSRRRRLRAAGLTITASLLGLFAWGCLVGYQQRMATAAERASLAASAIEERVQRVLDAAGHLDLVRIDPLLREIAGTTGVAALLHDDGTLVASSSPQTSAWLGAPIAGRPLLMPASVHGTERDDGSAFVVHYRPVTGWPLIATVGIARSEIVRSWLPMLAASTAFALLLAAGILALTERLIREIRQRQASETRFRDFAESASDWLWEQGPDLRFSYVSPHAEPTGSSVMAEPVGKTRRETKPIVSEAVLAAHEEDLALRRPFRNFTFSRIDSLGKLRHVSISGRPFFDEDGDFQGYRGTGHDITAEVDAWDIAAKAQSKLDQQRHLLQTIIDTVPAAVSVKDRELRYVLVNEALKARVMQTVRDPAAIQILGRTAAQVFGEGFGADDEAIDRYMLETGKPVPFHEVRATDRRGIERTYLTTRLPLRIDDSGSASILSVAIDVTEQREAELRLRDAIEAINAGFAMFDASDRLVAWNRQYADLWTASADAAIPDGRERIQRLLRPGILFEDLVRGLADAGAHRAAGMVDAEAWVEGRIAAHEAPGHPIELRIEDSWIRVSNHRTEHGGYVTLMTDITQLKLRGAELAAQSTLLRATLESLSEGVAVVDFSGRFLAWNRRYVQLGGLPADFTGGTLADAVADQVRTGEIAATSIADVLQGWRRAIATREPVHVERRRPDGSHVELAGLPVAGIGHVIVVRDVTKERRTMLQLQEARDRAESSNRAKSAFLANMSHELRTPLNAILGFAEVMEQQLLGPLGNGRYVAYATDIRFSGSHLLQLINDVLDLSKIEAGRVEMVEELLDVPSLGRDCIRLLDERARDAGIGWIEAIPADLPLLKADARSVRQILLNLLTNAVKFTGRGGTVTFAATGQADGSLAIRIADTGSGIPEAEIATIFEPFRHRSDALVSRKKEGTGLGLSICKRLTEMHGGTIEIESMVNRGTAVTLRFPASRVVEPAIAD